VSRSPRKQTLRQLQDLQRLAAAVIMQQLGRGMRTGRRFRDGRSNAAVARTFIKPNDRLTSLERIEIYNKQYWFRLVDCLFEDYPGLLAVVGLRRFNHLIREYIAANPSRSFTLRNLGSQLPQFLEKNPALAGPRRRMALDMAYFEWAQVVAFDGPCLPSLTVDDLLGANSAKLRLGLQPYITLLKMNYPLDDFSIALKRQATALRGEASNAIEEHGGNEGSGNKVPLPRPQTVFVAVHRHDNDLYYKRLEPAAYKVLTALAAGRTLLRACSFAESADQARRWFQNWTSLGWFAKRSR